MTSGPFDDVRLPIYIERGAKGGPGFSTTIKDLAGGKEKRNQNWSRSRGRWDIGYAIDDLAGLYPVVAFFYARRARARGFRFRDWSDYHVDRQTIAVADGTKRVFQIIKRYQDDGGSYDRLITRPVRGTVRVWVDGTEQALLPDGWEDAGDDPAPFALLSETPTVYAALDPATAAPIVGTTAPVLFGLDALTITLQDQGGKAGGVAVLSTQDIAAGKRMFESTTNPTVGANSAGRDSIVVGLRAPSWGGWGTAGGLIAFVDGVIVGEDGSPIVPSPVIDPAAAPLCLGFAVDHDAGQVQIHVNGVHVVTTPCVPGRAYRPIAGTIADATRNIVSSRLTLNFGASAFSYPIDGFKAVYTGDDPGTPGGPGTDPDPVRPMPPAGTVAVDPSTGQVLFGTALATGAIIEVACEYDIPVRFDVDDLDVEMRSGQYAAIPAIPVREIKE